jgi:hypothetical protein
MPSGGSTHGMADRVSFNYPHEERESQSRPSRPECTKNSLTVDPDSANSHFVCSERGAKLRDLSIKTLALMSGPGAREPVGVDVGDPSSAGVVV